MALASGTRRVYNRFYRNKATSGSMAPTPSQIEEYFASQGFDANSLTDEQFNQTVNYFSSCELSTVSQDSNINSPETSITLTEQQKHEIVTKKAAQMSIQLSASDISYVADQIDNQTGSTLDEILHQTETLLCAYADHKQQESIQKIDSMFGRVHNHVQANNAQTANHISNNLQRLGNEIEQSQQDLKSSVLGALQRIKITSISA